MRLIPRHRQRQRHRRSQIPITQEEISADLHYPASSREPQRTAGYRRLEVR